jgi:hypothetical protein
MRQVATTSLPAVEHPLKKTALMKSVAIRFIWNFIWGPSNKKIFIIMR